ncbi:MAG: FAD-dependent oxidoreductase [Patescibacteria group bacterium]|nr:FAD-dependent oxidoreductase [Patescibacteria group bacterium]
MSNVYDSIIIGASAGGISASIYLKRQGIEFSIIAKDIGGEMALSGIVENYPGFPETNGVELAKKFREHMEKYQIKPIIEEVLSLEIKKPNGFIIKTNKNTYEAKTIIIATGSSPKKLNIPGEDKFYHKGLSYCSVCDLPLFKNKIVAIIGGGNSANEGGIMGSRICQKVYIINKNPEMKGDKVLIEELKSKENVEIIYNALTQEIYGDQKVSGLKYLDKMTGEVKNLAVDGIFIHIGLKPNSEFVPDAWNIKNEYGEIIVNQLCQTSIPGVFAAGDVTNIPHKQIGVAVGQGIIASLEVVKYLNTIR